VKENKSGGVYVDAVVLVNQAKESDGADRTPTRWQVRITGRTAENAASLRKGTRLLVTGSVVTDSWADKTTGEVRYATRVLAQSVGVSLTRSPTSNSASSPRPTTGQVRTSDRSAGRQPATDWKGR
jgi:single-strand DNA-binding protein